MKIKFSILYLITILSGSPSFSQIQYIIRLFAKSENHVSIKTLDKGHYKEIKTVNSEDLYNKIKKYKSAGKELSLFEADYRQLVKSKTDKQIDEAILKASLGSQYQKSAGSGLIASRGRGSLCYLNFIPPKFKVKKTISKYAAIDKSDVLISIPSDKNEYKNIFGSDYKSLGSFTKLSKELRDAKNNNIQFPASSSSFLQIIEKRLIDKPLILIGHNENGIFKFPDGSSITFNEIDEIVDNSDRYPIIYLSCNAAEKTSNAAVDFKLTYDEALKITLSLDNKFSNQALDKEKIKEVFDHCIVDFSKDKKKRKVMYLTLAGGAGVTYYLYIITNEKK